MFVKKEISLKLLKIANAKIAFSLWLDLGIKFLQWCKFIWVKYITRHQNLKFLGLCANKK